MIKENTFESLPIRRRLREDGNISRNRRFYSLEVPDLAIVIWQSGK
jgi:hypothetical protein